MKLLIFDFDGTIVDTKQVYFKAMSKHLNHLGFSKKQIEEVISLGMNLRETIKKFAPSLVRGWWIERKVMKDVVKEAKKVKKCKDVSDIRKIKGKKILITNSFRDFVFPILRHLKLRKYFSEIYTADDFNNKAKFIKEYLKKNKIKRSNCYYIGDRVSDVIVARETEVKSIIVLGKSAWDSRDEVLRAKPDFIVGDLGDIMKIIR